jgi:hypothetical protein
VSLRRAHDEAVDSSRESSDTKTTAARRLRAAFAEPLSDLAAAVRADDCAGPILPREEQLDDSIEVELSAVGLASLARARVLAIPGYYAVPIGEYGRDFAAQLLDAASGLQYAITPAASETTGKDLGSHHPAYQTLLIGTVSVVEAIAHLTAYRVEGFADPQKLIGALTQSRAVDELATLLPLSVIGPMSRSGWLFPRPILQRTGPASVELTPQLREFLLREKQQYLADLNATAEPQTPAVKRYFLATPNAGSGCPVARGANSPLADLVNATGDWIARRQWVLQNVVPTTEPPGIAFG